MKSTRRLAHAKLGLLSALAHRLALFLMLVSFLHKLSVLEPDFIIPPCDPPAHVVSHLDNEYKPETTQMCLSSLFSRHLNRLPPRPGYRSTHITLLVLILSGDISLNPGPRRCDILPCGYCQQHVSWSNSGIACENCDIWFHRSCADMNPSHYELLANNSVAWVCFKCHSVNNTDSFFHSFELDTQNVFDPLSHVNHDDSVFSVASFNTSFNPARHSSPVRSDSLPYTSQRSSATRPSQNLTRSSRQSHASKPSQSDADSVPAKKQNWRTLVVNCNGVMSKKAELSNLTNYTNPDILLLTETKIDNTISTSEFLPDGYTGEFRKDRTMGGGGVLIAIKSIYNAESIDLIDINAETVWAEISLKDHKKLVVGSFYRQPDHRTIQLDELEKALTQISDKYKNNPDCTIFLGGDFNCGDITWETGTVQANSNRKNVCERLIQLLSDFDLTQVHQDPTREGKILDILCTNKPGLVKSTTSIPGISDHDIILADSDLKPTIQKKPPRKILQWSKANWEVIRNKAIEFRDTFLSEYSDRSVEENYSVFKSFISAICDDYIPNKLSSSRISLPWITQGLKRMCRKKQRLFNAAKKSGTTKAWQRYKDHKKATLKALREARWTYINDILQTGLENNDSRPFWKYIKARRQDSFGVSPLKYDGSMHTDTAAKCEVLNQQFKSVFTKDQPGPVPQLPGEALPSIAPLTFNVPGVVKLLI